MSAAKFTVAQRDGKWRSLITRDRKVYACGHQHGTRELAEKCGQKRAAA